MHAVHGALACGIAMRVGMKVIWKRPDGFLNAQPSDFKVVDLDGHFTIWLHKEDHTWFPFRVSGDWKEEESTKSLNGWVNLLDRTESDWLASVQNSYGHSKAESPAQYITDTCNWISSLKAHLKGDSWELEIMSKALDCVSDRIKNIQPGKLKPTTK